MLSSDLATAFQSVSAPRATYEYTELSLAGTRDLGACAHRRCERSYFGSLRPMASTLLVSHLMPAIKLAVAPRVKLQLHERATKRQYRELGVFVRRCVTKIERDTGRTGSWSIRIIPDRVCYCCDVIVRHEGGVVRASGNGFDGAVAGYEAFNKLEMMLREHRPARSSHHREVICGRR